MRGRIAVTQNRPEVLWIGPALSDAKSREFSQRDLVLVPDPGPADPAWARAKALVLAIDPGGGPSDAPTPGDILRDQAAFLLDHGARIEIIAQDDASLSAFLAGPGGSVRHDLIRHRVSPPFHRLAEDIARYDPGPAAYPGLAIVMGKNQVPLAKRDVPLVRRAFHDCTRIVLVELTGGRSDARVFAVYANLAGSNPGVRPQPSFAKIDAHEKIVREFNNYRAHADRYIPFGLRPNVQHIVSGYERGLLIGDFVDRSQSLWDLVRQDGAAQALHALIYDTLAGWRDQGHAKEPIKGSIAATLANKSFCDPKKICQPYAELSCVADTPDAVWGRLTALDKQEFLAAPMHGDLHGENVRVRNGQAIIIDLASVAADGPLTADLAALETWLAFELPPEDPAEEWENPTWREEIDRLYAPAAFVRPLGPCDPISGYQGIVAAVRQLRQMGIAAQYCPGEYQTVVAVSLLRRCQWMGSSPADRYRRATGYAIAAQLARHLEETSQ